MNTLANYQKELYSLGYNPKTIYSKIRNIKSFLSTLQKPLVQIKIQDLESYLNQLKQRNLHTSTIYQYYTHVQEYFTYLKAHHYIIKNPFSVYILQLKKEAYKPRNILSQQEIQELYNHCIIIQERMILHLCYGCGLRALELERINLENLDIENKLVIIEKGKNSKRRIIPINQNLQKEFIDYLQYRNSIQTQENALLLNQSFTRMKKYTALEILKKILKRTSQSRSITLHSLRHSIATHLLENGIKLENVRDFLGHKYLDTTENYIRITKLDL